jgi:hypothetical protein
VGIGKTSPKWALDVGGHVNSASGYLIGESLVLTLAGSVSDSNIALGYQAYAKNSGGSLNTGIGAYALNAGAVGGFETAVGAYALSSDSAGSQNTAIGAYALAANQGDQQGDGNGNTADGNFALRQNTTGSENTAVGTYALESNTSGSDLTCIGYQCGAAGAASLHNATAIGAHAVVSASDALVLGGTGIHAVKVGIGTETPSNVLTVALGAGHPVSDGWETFSSRRWKTNIQTLRGALGKVERLRGVSYDMRDSGKHEVGVIAEEVGAVVPEIVSWDENRKDANGVDYGRLTALLIEAVKDQQEQIAQQNLQVDALRVELQQRATKEADLEMRLAQMERDQSGEVKVASTKPMP